MRKLDLSSALALVGGTLCLVALTVAGNVARADTETFQSGFQHACVAKALSKAEADGRPTDADAQKKMNAACACSAQRLAEQLSPEEMANLVSKKPDPALIEKVRPVVHQCAKENLIK